MAVQRWLSHRLTVRRFSLRGKVVLREPLRIGSGREEGLTSLADLRVLRIRVSGVEVPVIPGSTWKGVFRSGSEAILRAAGEPVCGGVPGDTCVDRTGIGGWLNKVLKKPTEDTRMEVLKVLSDKLCLSCKIFGAPSYAAKVTFSNSFPVTEDGSARYSLGVKPGVAISRKTGAVSKGALYKVEYVEPGSEFWFEMTAENLPNYALGLLAAVVMGMQRGDVRIGGFKSRGFGRIEFNDLRHRVSPSGWIVPAGEGAKLRGFTDQGEPWYDPRDEDVQFDNTTLDLLERLASRWEGE